MVIMTSSKLGQLEASPAAKLLQEVERLTKENGELAKLRQDNLRLQERNVQLAAELAVRTRELEVALSPGKVELTSTDSDLSDVREPVGGLMPGDSYPAVAASLDDIDSDVNTDSEELEAGAGRGGGGGGEPDYLLQKLRKGGTRMEQIKRQLVVQRGAIVAALKILAQSRTGSGSGSLSSYKSAGAGDEKDRVLVSITASVAKETKLCPMCEAVFPLEAEEEFETHVMDHFSYDSDPDTLQYLDTADTDLQTDHL